MLGLKTDYMYTMKMYVYHEIIFYMSIFIFFKISFRNTLRVSNSLDPDQARHFVGTGLDPNCLQKLSADDTSRQRALELTICIFLYVQFHFFSEEGRIY